MKNRKLKTPKLKIQVRRFPPGEVHNYSKNYTVVETIERKIWSEAIGNFNPLFCTYQGKRTLVHSDEGDVSDPFRREESYLSCLYVIDETNPA